MTPLELSFSIIAVAAVGIASLKAKIIDRTGFVAATLVGCPILIFGGPKWFATLLSFHLTTAFFTKYRYEKKLKMEAAETKGGARAWQNVLSNGAIASILAICYGLTSLKMFAVGYLGTVSTSISDTLATELGLLSIGEPRLVTNLSVKVKAGTSGGITFLGEVAGLFGSSIIALIAFIIDFEGLSISQILIFNLLIGFLACNLDSLIGATVQAAFKCQKCGKNTEKKMHCDLSTEHYKGLKFIDNNVVNFVSTMFGALIAILLYPIS